MFFFIGLFLFSFVYAMQLVTPSAVAIADRMLIVV